VHRSGNVMFAQRETEGPEKHCPWKIFSMAGPGALPVLAAS
jgi:hypothetical protein